MLRVLHELWINPHLRPLFISTLLFHIKDHPFLEDDYDKKNLEKALME